MGTISSSELTTSTAVLCRLAEDDVELAAHFDVRRRVFVELQMLFEGTDRDDRAGDRLAAVALRDAARQRCRRRRWLAGARAGGRSAVRRTRRGLRRIIG